jgi:HPt (histidine-containing phosphotransfer) domain-containing protein
MRPHNRRGGAAALSNINADTIRRAEEAVGKLTDEYRSWVRGDLEKLQACMAAAAAGGEARTTAYKEVRHIAHDLRGQGATFGFPLVTRIAQSISQVLKERPADVDIDSDAILTAHFEALHTVIEQNVSDLNGTDAQAIVATLEAAIGRALA